MARGNLKVFEEIGYEFAVEEPLPQVAFAGYDEAFAEADPKRRAELTLRSSS